MRTYWLAILALVLALGTSLPAQEYGYGAPYSSLAQNGQMKPPPRNEPLPPPTAENAPAAPPAAPAPVAAPPQAGMVAPGDGGNCAGCRHRGRASACWSRLREWVCFRPIRGGCPKCGACTGNCFIPPYLFFINDCHAGKCHDLPDCCCAKTGAQIAQPFQRLANRPGCKGDDGFVLPGIQPGGGNSGFVMPGIEARWGH